jgi:hypothetical protein
VKVGEREGAQEAEGQPMIGGSDEGLPIRNHPQKPPASSLTSAMGHAGRIIRRLRQAEPRTKQLIVLLCVASWISIVLFWALNAYALGYALQFTLVCSIPAFAFGAILFWWFRD